MGERSASGCADPQNPCKNATTGVDFTSAHELMHALFCAHTNRVLQRFHLVCHKLSRSQQEALLFLIAKPLAENGLPGEQAATYQTLGAEEFKVGLSRGRVHCRSAYWCHEYHTRRAPHKRWQPYVAGLLENCPPNDPLAIMSRPDIGLL